MSASTTEPCRSEFEFPYSDAQFLTIIKLVNRFTGINLSEEKKPLTYSRFSKIIRRRGLASFDEYIALVEKGDEQVQLEFVNSITTNFTSFFREDHHFDFLRDYLKNRKSSRPVRIWSAGCSSGEEPYSIVMAAVEALGEAGLNQISLLATDLDRDILTKAERGVYSEDRIRNLSASRCRQFFQRGTKDNQGLVRIKPALRKVIEFRQLNFMDNWSHPVPFDLIFCRNVMIYFDRDTQNTLVRKFAKCQTPGGRLIIGHSENMSSDIRDYRLVGKTIYERL